MPPTTPLAQNLLGGLFNLLSQQSADPRSAGLGSVGIGNNDLLSFLQYLTGGGAGPRAAVPAMNPTAIPVTTPLGMHPGLFPGGVPQLTAQQLAQAQGSPYMPAAMHAYSGGGYGRPGGFMWHGQWRPYGSRGGGSVRPPRSVMPTALPQLPFEPAGFIPGVGLAGAPSAALLAGTGGWRPPVQSRSAGVNPGSNLIYVLSGEQDLNSGPRTTTIQNQDPGNIQNQDPGNLQPLMYARR